MMKSNEVKLLTESVMTEDMDRSVAEEKAKSLNDRIETVAGLTNEKDYRSGVIDIRNAPELEFIMNNPVTFESGIMKTMTSGALSKIISMEEAARCVAIANVVRSAVTTAEPITIFDMYQGARLSDKSEGGKTLIEYDSFNIDVCRSVSESLDRMVEAVSKSVKGMDINDKPSLLGYGQVLTVLRCI